MYCRQYHICACHNRKRPNSERCNVFRPSNVCTYSSGQSFSIFIPISTSSDSPYTPQHYKTNTASFKTNTASSCIRYLQQYYRHCTLATGQDRLCQPPCPGPIAISFSPPTIRLAPPSHPQLITSPLLGPPLSPPHHSCNLSQSPLITSRRPWTLVLGPWSATVTPSDTFA